MGSRNPREDGAKADTQFFLSAACWARPGALSGRVSAKPACWAVLLGTKGSKLWIRRQPAGMALMEPPQVTWILCALAHRMAEK